MDNNNLIYDGAVSMTRQGKAEAKKVNRIKSGKETKKSNMKSKTKSITTLQKLAAGVLLVAIVYLTGKGIIHVGQQNQKVEELTKLFANNYGYTMDYNGDYQFFTTKPLDHVAPQPGYYREVTNEELAEDIYYMDGISEEDKTTLAKESGAYREYKEMLENVKGNSR